MTLEQLHKVWCQSLWEPLGLYGPADQNNEQLKASENRKALEGRGLIHIGSTGNIFTFDLVVISQVFNAHTYI